MLNSQILLDTASRFLGPDLNLRLHYVHITPSMLQFRRALEATFRGMNASRLQAKPTIVTPRTRKSLPGLKQLGRKRSLKRPGRVRRRVNYSRRDDILHAN